MTRNMLHKISQDMLDMRARLAAAAYNERLDVTVRIDMVDKLLNLANDLMLELMGFWEPQDSETDTLDKPRW